MIAHDHDQPNELAGSACHWLSMGTADTFRRSL